MQEPPQSHNESRRLEALRSTGLMDTPFEERFQRITRLAQKFFTVPIAAISLIEEDRQWCKAAIGLSERSVPRAISFCGHAILEDAMMVVEDARLDPRFENNPLVVTNPGLRFYAGIPLRGHDQAHIGTLCILDIEPHGAGEMDLSVLSDLAALVERELLFESALNAHSGNPMDLSDRPLLLDDVTGLWNWDGIIRLLEEARHRIHLSGGQQSLAWVDVGFTMPAGADAQAPDDVQRELANLILGVLDFRDTAGTVGQGQFILIIGNGNRESLTTVLSLLAERIRRFFGEHPANLAHLGLSACTGVSTDLGLADLIEQLERDRPGADQPPGTLTLRHFDDVEQVRLLRK
ncbi:diguanylate cyclase with GAF sensor [Marinobacter daqiaonensis]|uniref:Diguanylate cyclase with GAF sensor n=1 Tax=Marinobacter daqiaonensis TaxID=650891 RepID=A0A1I6IK45_9GAMM|nr:GAF domain-containing protein [Marinobacter daqiaonensis]SFR67061.1 diguanylate cyclase with GAF sensor [Marinobacter daqiaonensis]